MPSPMKSDDPSPQPPPTRVDRDRPLSWSALVLLLAALAVAAGCPQESPPIQVPHVDMRPDGPDVILISIDSLRADHLGCYGYTPDTSPTMDRLAEEGARFENAISTTSWTLPAHAAMFTGLYDFAHGVVDEASDRLAPENHTLAEVFRAAGYQTSGFFGGPYLHPAFGLDQGFESYLSCMTKIPDNISDGAVRADEGINDAAHADITGPRTVKRFGEWLDSADDRPMFVFLHLWDVHYDYIPPLRYAEMFDPDYTGTMTATDIDHNPMLRSDMPPRDLEHVIAMYDGEIRFTDDVIGQILEKLAAAGRLDDALLVITSDHGEEFFEHGNSSHKKTLFEEVVRVPLIVRWRGHVEPGTVVRDQVCLTDLMPTILALADVKASVPTQGRDISQLLSGQPLEPKPVLLELLSCRLPKVGLRTNTHKLVVDQRLGRGALFDLAADPREAVGLPGAGGEANPRAKTMLAQLEQLVEESVAWKERTGSLAFRAADLDEDVLRRLETLGYVRRNGKPKGRDK